LLKFIAGFIRINPATAPLNPPGAAPTLTTVYDEADSILPSESTFPSNSLSKESPAATAKQKTKLKHRLRLSGKPAPAGAVVEGTEKEKKRVQGIADSLDLRSDLSADLEPAPSKGPRMEVERRTGTAIGVGEPNQVIGEGNGRLGFKDERRASIGMGLYGGNRRCSVG